MDIFDALNGALTIGEEEPGFTGFTAEEAALWKTCQAQLESLVVQTDEVHRRMMELQKVAQKRVEDEPDEGGLSYKERKLANHLVSLARQVEMQAHDLRTLRKLAIEEHIAGHLPMLKPAILDWVCDKLVD